jgi:hypothetical protein
LCVVKLNGRGGRIVSAKGNDNGTPRPEYRFELFGFVMLLCCTDAFHLSEMIINLFP